MKILLLILGAVLVLGSVVLAVFVEPKSAAVSGGSWNIPFWPFVGVVGIILILIWVAVMPFGRELLRMYFSTKVAIARAENHVPDEKDPINPTPPAPDKPPTDVAKG